MITITDVLEASHELTIGSKQPNIKFALWGAALSAQQSLELNGVGMRVLAAYVDSQLPDRDYLYQELISWKLNINNNHLNALYHAEYLEQTGELDVLANFMSPNIQDQLSWRKAAYDLFHPYDEKTCKRHGMGMGWKCISFALMLLNPATCQLVPIDRHHLARLGYPSNKNIGNYGTYLRIESEIRQEALSEGLAGIPLSLFAWLKWEAYRQDKGVSTETGKIQSHVLLSCRMY